MPSTLVDLVKITANSTGTGAIALGAAVPAYRGVEALTNGGIYSYAIQQDSTYEYGRGTYLASGNMFIRTPTFSSNGGAAIVLAPNAEVAFVALAEDLTASGGAASLASVDLSNVNWPLLPPATLSAMFQAMQSAGVFAGFLGV